MCETRVVLLPGANESSESSGSCLGSRVVAALF